MGLIEAAENQNQKKQRDAIDMLADLDDVPSSFQVGDKWVHLRTRFPVEDYFDIPGLIRHIDREDVRSQIPIFAKVVESWDFDGEPSDPSVYGKMDLFEEFMPLSDKIQRYITRNMGVSLKNSGRVSGLD